MTKQELETKLQDCKALMEQGLISQQDFDREKQSLLDQWRGQGTRPASVTKTLMDLQVNMEVGPANARFILTKELGRGGMASVWKAKDIAESERRGHECYKALKFLHPDFSHSSAHHKRLQREADNAKQLRHPNIVGVYGFEQGNDQQLFLIMDYLQGRDLSEVLEDEGKGQGLSWDRIKTLMTPVAEALDYAHQEHKLIHRDIKPANLFLTDQGQIKILDFGLSEQIQQSGLQLGMKTDNRSGTKVYWAPEVCVGSQLAPSRDVYAFSAVIYELLTGQPPFAEAIVCERTATLKAKQPVGLNDQAWEVLCRGLAYEVDKRFACSQALWRALVNAQTVDNVQAKTVKENKHSLLKKLLTFSMNKQNADAGRIPAVEQTRDNENALDGFLSDVIDNPAELEQHWDTHFNNPIANKTGTKKPPPLIDGWSSEQVKQLQQKTVYSLGYTNEKIQEQLKDGSLAPRMIILPSARYTMGSPKNEPEREPWQKGSETQHLVTISAFAIGQTTVTFEDYQKYCKAKQTKPPSDKGWGKGHRPVININWYEAMEYANWLSEQTGKCYRLPTEAEWEYACRSGTTTPFYTGQTINSNQANFNGRYTYNGSAKGKFLEKTVEVGSYEPNAFGLYEMHGNVWEWVASAYHTRFLGQEEQIADKADQSLRVVRGGSWFSVPRWLRSAYRGRFTPDFRYNGVGFRLAQDLTL